MHIVSSLREIASEIKCNAFHVTDYYNFKVMSYFMICRETTFAGLSPKITTCHDTNEKKGRILFHY